MAAPLVFIFGLTDNNELLMLVFQIKAFWEIGSSLVLPPVNVRAELCKEQFSWCVWLSQHSQLAFKCLCSAMRCEQLAGTCPCSCVPLIYWLGWGVQPFTDVGFCAEIIERFRFICMVCGAEIKSAVKSLQWLPRETWSPSGYVH